MASSSLSGLKIRTARKGLGVPQSELARQAGISASYLNLIEQNKRPVTDSLLDRIAACLGMDRRLLETETEQRIVDELNEISADTTVASQAAQRGATEKFVGQCPDWAGILLNVYRAYRQRAQDVQALADRLNHDPFLGESVHRLLTKVASIRSAAEIVDMGDGLPSADRDRFIGIIAADSADLSRTAQSLVEFFENADARVRAATPTEHVDGFLFRRQNYFPELESLAERLAEHYDCIAPISPPAAGASGMGPFVAAETSRFEALRAHVARAANEPIRANLDGDHELADADASALAFKALCSYTTAAVLMPYAPFYEAAERHRYDLDILTRLFGVSYEQAAHRLTTLRRPGAEGPRFAFMRSDPSGFITKRLPLPQLPLPRFGHACPLWVVYGAFQSPGTTSRAYGALPSGEQFLFTARAIEKRPTRPGFPRSLVSIMLACSERDALRVAAGDGLDRAAAMVPLGTTCRLCPRADCGYRQEARLTV
ncbi:MAG: short-chain fatty acyl-CoA regulator family protein [Hyphomicrobiaceae bacterium]